MDFPPSAAGAAAPRGPRARRAAGRDQQDPAPALPVACMLLVERRPQPPHPFADARPHGASRDLPAPSDLGRVEPVVEARDQGAAVGLV
jgi:hypothetical protein